MDIDDDADDEYGGSELKPGPVNLRQSYKRELAKLSMGSSWLRGLSVWRVGMLTPVRLESLAY
ncbi:MAG TPA: hypothetical protein VGN42_14855 [Pirellulales bacterium]|jgi:hypothetical protein|nr:hypothetical protein [Pirellulales bacterium]